MTLCYIRRYLYLLPLFSSIGLCDLRMESHRHDHCNLLFKKVFSLTCRRIVECYPRYGFILIKYIHTYRLFTYETEPTVGSSLHNWFSLQLTYTLAVAIIIFNKYFQLWWCVGHTPWTKKGILHMKMYLIFC